MRKLLQGEYIRLKNLKEKCRDNFYGDKNYKKFVIISDSRTGSTLLMQLLDSHPEILCFGEEFKNLKAITCREVWNKIYRKRPKSVNWVGFKLFYFHPWQNKDQEVWDFIEADKKMVVIHLTRRNILRSYVSKQIGLKTRKWTENINRPHEIDEDEKKVNLDYEGCRENFESISGYIEQTENRFRDHKIISVVYEDLNKDKQSVMDRIYGGLGVAHSKVDTYMKKQNPEKLEDLVINFSEIQKEFSGTRWEYLFEE